ncbi:hypothetical protein CNMCM7691_000519 [Aspergillus felis]|uniref:chanoclavine-I dehydrogenase n=1 Tax=Aspergillus felis TaxID=1287682 RepID=A0A8H6QY20_9EURO|nr:hypothetical protein CNMCM7691_000519 [Aspergillus felis]
MASVESRIFAITGGASGIGAATCRLLAERGAAVLCVCDISSKDFDKLITSIKKINPSTKVHCATVDVTSSVEVEQWIRSIIAEFGDLHGSANVAGIAQGAGMRNTPTVAEETDEEWRRILNTNLNGVFYCTREQVRAMKGLPAGDRCIVNIGSIASVFHMPDVYAYGTSKGACAYFTTCVAADTFPLGIRVNNVSPGVTNTPMLPQFAPHAKTIAEIEESYKKEGLSLIEAEDVARTIVWLLSEDSRPEMFPSYPGFDMFREDTDGRTVLQDAVKFGSTWRLGEPASGHLNMQSTRLLSEETSTLVKKLWGDEPEWHEVTAKSSVHISSPTYQPCFLWARVINNKDRVEVTDEYAPVGFLAARELRLWPQILRRIAHGLIPSCTRLRYLASRSRSLIERVIAAQQEEKARCASQGQKLPSYDDAIEWTGRAAKGRSYYAAMIILDLSMQRDLIAVLRQEILSSTPQENESKNASLNQLLLMHSAIKESQLLKPTESNMHF